MGDRTEILVKLLDEARMLQHGGEPENVVVELKTITGETRYFGLSLESAELLVARWAADIRMMSRRNVGLGRCGQ